MAPSARSLDAVLHVGGGGGGGGGGEFIHFRGLPTNL